MESYFSRSEFIHRAKGPSGRRPSFPQGQVNQLTEGEWLTCNLYKSICKITYIIDYYWKKRKKKFLPPGEVLPRCHLKIHLCILYLYVHNLKYSFDLQKSNEHSILCTRLRELSHRYQLPRNEVTCRLFLYVFKNFCFKNKHTQVFLYSS